MLPVALSSLHLQASVADALRALRITWSMLFVCAGVLRLVRWRLTGEAAMAYHGSALVTFGLIAAPSSMMSPLMMHTEPAASLGPIARMVCVVACLSLAARGLRAPAVNARLRPVRLTAITTAIAWSAVLLMTVISKWISLDRNNGLWMGVEAALTLGWLGCGFVATRRGLRLDRPSLFWAGVCMLSMATAEAMRAIAFTAPSPISAIATCLQLATASVIVANAAADLGEVFSSEGNRMLSLAGALEDTALLLDEEQRRRDERLHDARSVIAALKAASFTLERYGERLDDAMQNRLRSSFASELSRLESVLAARAKEPLRRFPLGVALAPLFIAERKNGMVINSQLGSLRIEGRPLELVAVVQNLLAQVRQHAAGRPVTVRALGNVDGTHIYIEYSRSLFSSDQRARVFDRGFHHDETASRSDGHLHLSLTRRMMREQGGDIRLEERPGGGDRFVITLPAVRTTTKPAGDATKHPGEFGANASRPQLAWQPRIEAT